MRITLQKVLLLAASIAGMALALGGCKQAPELPSVLSPYKIDIQQGNIVTQDMLDKLKSGMTRAQVKYVLGSPLVVDPFRGDRWDYVSMYQRQGKDVERRRLTVIFDEDKLVRIEGDVTLTDRSLEPAPAPVEKPAAKPAPAVKPAAAVAPAVKPEAPQPVAPPAAAVKPPVVPEKSSAVPEAPKPAAAADAVPVDAAKTAAPAEDKKADAAKKEAPKEKPKPGFFGRMLDKLGI